MALNRSDFQVIAGYRGAWTGYYDWVVVTQWLGEDRIVFKGSAYECGHYVREQTEGDTDV